MTQNQVTKNLENVLHEKIAAFLAEEDVTPYETPLKNATQIKKEIEDRFLEFIHGMSQSLKRAESLIHKDLHFVATPEELTTVQNELANMGETFFGHVNASENQDDEILLDEAAAPASQPNTLQEMLGISDSSMLLFYKLSIYYNEKHDYGKAKDLLHLLLSLNARISTYWVAMGVCCQSQHKYEEALSYFKGGAEANPNNPAPHFYASACYCEMKHLTEARSELEAAEKVVSHLSAEEQPHWHSWSTFLNNKSKQ